MSDFEIIENIIGDNLKSLNYSKRGYFIINLVINCDEKYRDRIVDEVSAGLGVDRASIIISPQ